MPNAFNMTCLPGDLPDDLSGVVLTKTEASAEGDPTGELEALSSLQPRPPRLTPLAGVGFSKILFIIKFRFLYLCVSVLICVPNFNISTAKWFESKPANVDGSFSGMLAQLNNS